MKISKQKQQPLKGLALILLVIVLVGIVLVQNRHVASPQATPKLAKGNTTQDEPSPSAQASGAPKPSGAPSTVTIKPAKPVLQKSSGNAPGSSVPVGAVIEYTCEGTPGVSCEIVLTSKTTGKVVTLAKTTITSNGRGQYFAIWDWQAEQGSWSILAKATNAVGDAAVSDTQTLEVK
jgi:hypothetical protein